MGWQSKLRTGGSLWLLAGVLASGQGRAAAEAPALNYDVETALTFIDAARLPQTVSTAPLLGRGPSQSLLAAPVPASQPRSLGLRRLALGLTWQAASAASLHLVLRPDAVNRLQETGSDGGVAREMDTRAGDPGMQPLPTIRLLDEYQLVLHGTADLSAGVGVWSGLATAAGAYPELLGFGLQVLLPAKFAGVRLGWQHRDLSPSDAAFAGSKPTPLSVDAYLFQGDEDRLEQLGGKHDTYDTAPVASDPYYGSAAVIRLEVTPGLSLGLTGGYLTQTSTQGRFDGFFGQLSGSYRWSVAGHRGKTALDARYLASHGSDVVAPQTLTSATVSNAVAVANGLWALAGVSYGKGDRWLASAQRGSTKALQGYELQGGVMGDIVGGLSWQLLLSRDYRKSTEAGVQSGGFQDSLGNRSLINRLGLELSYKLDKNA